MRHVNLIKEPYGRLMAVRGCRAYDYPRPHNQMDLESRLHEPPKCKSSLKSNQDSGSRTNLAASHFSSAFASLLTETKSMTTHLFTPGSFPNGALRPGYRACGFRKWSLLGFSWTNGRQVRDALAIASMPRKTGCMGGDRARMSSPVSAFAQRGGWTECGEVKMKILCSSFHRLGNSRAASSSAHVELGKQATESNVHQHVQIFACPVPFGLALGGSMGIPNPLAALSQLMS